MIPSCWKAEQLPEASVKARKWKARHSCVQCNDVSRMTAFTQNHTQQLQLESKLRLETVMWETKMSSMGLFQEGTSANTLVSPLPLTHHLPTPSGGILTNQFEHVLIFIEPFHQWVKLLGLKNLICIFFL